MAGGTVKGIYSRRNGRRRQVAIRHATYVTDDGKPGIHISFSLQVRPENGDESESGEVYAEFIRHNAL